MYIDTHCHLNHPQYDNDIEAAILRASAASVSPLLVAGYDLESSYAAVRFAEQHHSVFASVGVHPHEAKTFTQDTRDQLADLARKPKVVAIGEIGLDYYYDLSDRSDQISAMRSQLRLAEELDLPLIIHCREAYTDVLDELGENESLFGVMHCWAGTQSDAERAIGLGFNLGFGGMLTFSKCADIQDVAKLVDLQTIILETDAPYLAPHPYRGKRNEPAYIPIVAKALASLRGCDVDEIARVTTANALRLFPKLSH